MNAAAEVPAYGQVRLEDHSTGKMQCEVHKPAEKQEQACRREPSAGASSQFDALVIVNADDWGLNAAVTECILSCAQARAISSVSAMVFMDDSERAADLAREHDIDAGLHLNLTCAFTATGVPSNLLEHQRRVAAFLRFERYARVLFNPLLARSFDYVTRAQIEEFERIYGAPPRRIDGHHHMHLSANVLAQKLLPTNAVIRRNQSFAAGEMSALNRWYRRTQDRHLARHFTTTDYFFDLCPIETSRLARILDRAREWSVEIGCHPDRIEESEFLMSGELAGWGVAIAQGYTLHPLHKSETTDGAVQNTEVHR